MGAEIRDPWGDGRNASVLDGACALRPCLWIAEDKGSFTPGVGYTSYHATPRLVCMTRHSNGCPHPLPEIDREKARCCPSPEFAKPRKDSRPYAQACRTCNTRVSGLRLEAVKLLPKFQATKCAHVGARETTWYGDPAWRCSECQLWFDSKPKHHESGKTVEAFGNLRHEAWLKKLQAMRDAADSDARHGTGEASV